MILGFALAFGADKREVAVLPALGYSSDTGLALGVATVLTQLGPEPFAWRFSGQVSASFKVDESGLAVPLADNFLRFERPGLAGGRLRLRTELTFIRQSDAGWYGLGNAAAEAEGWRYTRTGPAGHAELWWTLLDRGANVRAFAAVDAAYSWLEIPADSRLASDVAGGDGPAVAAALVGVTDHASGQATLGLMVDTRDDEFWPTSGVLHDVSGRAGGTGEGAWVGAAGTARVYVPLGTPRLILAAQLGGDLLAGKPPFYELGRRGGLAPAWAPGGQFGPRGVPLQRLHGAAKVLASVELRTMVWGFRLIGTDWELGPIAFADAGRVWARLTPSPELDGTVGMHVGAGGGLRLRMGEGAVFRFDFAGSPDGTGVYIDMGNTF